MVALSILSAAQTNPLAVISQFSGLTNINNNLVQKGISLIGNIIKKPATNIPNQDAFTLSAFTSQLKANGFRLAKQYYYNCHIYLTGTTSDVKKTLTFNCNSVTLPGWRAKTQVGKIYGIDYEIATSIEQDPVWMSFNVDIIHAIEQLFLSKQKRITFNENSYSPAYKEDTQFQMMIEVTDENFVPMFQYTLNNCIIRTVQQVTYGASTTETQHITVEVIYETIKVTDILSVRKPAVQPGQKPFDLSRIKVGPFSIDALNINTGLNIKSQLPSWFNSPTSI